MAERLKRLKAKLNEATERLRQGKEAVLQKDSELEAVMQELQRAETRVKIQRDQMEISEQDRNVLENNLRLIEIDRSNLAN
jgi:hypothetical protein